MKREWEVAAAGGKQGETAPESGPVKAFAWVEVGAPHPAQSGPELPQHVHWGLVGSTGTGMSDVLGMRVLDLQEQLRREPGRSYSCKEALGVQRPQSRLQGQQCACLAMLVPWL